MRFFYFVISENKRRNISSSVVWSTKFSGWNWNPHIGRDLCLIISGPSSEIARTSKSLGAYSIIHRCPSYTLFESPFLIPRILLSETATIFLTPVCLSHSFQRTAESGRYEFTPKTEPNYRDSYFLNKLYFFFKIFCIVHSSEIFAPRENH